METVVVVEEKHDEEWKEMMVASLRGVEAKIAKYENDVKMMICSPHTVQTVANVLGHKLTMEQDKQAELLAYTIFKHVYADKEPVDYGNDAARHHYYADDDMWIPRIAVRRTVEGVGCAEPCTSMISLEGWMKCCAVL